MDMKINCIQFQQSACEKENLINLIELAVSKNHLKLDVWNLMATVSHCTLETTK